MTTTRWGVWWVSVLALAACEPRASCGDDAGGASTDAAAIDLGAPSDDGGSDAAVAPSLVVLDHDALDLDTGCLGWPSTRTSVQLANAGATSVAVSASLVGAQADQFVVDLSSCAGGLAAGAFCTIALDSAYTSLGAVAANLVVDAGILHASLPVTVMVATCDAAPLAPASFSFGSVSVGARSTAQVFSIPNLGGALLAPFTAATIEGLDADQFQIVRDGCTGHALVPTASCDIDVVFAPTRAGSASASLVLDGYVSSSSMLSGTVP